MQVWQFQSPVKVAFKENCLIFIWHVQYAWSRTRQFTLQKIALHYSHFGKLHWPLISTSWLTCMVFITCTVFLVIVVNKVRDITESLCTAVLQILDWALITEALKCCSSCFAVLTFNVGYVCFQRVLFCYWHSGISFVLQMFVDMSACVM